MFDWIRRRVRDAVIAGIADAAEELSSNNRPTEDAQTRLETILLLSPSGTTEVEPTKRSGRRS